MHAQRAQSAQLAQRAQLARCAPSAKALFFDFMKAIMSINRRTLLASSAAATALGFIALEAGGAQSRDDCI